MKDPIERFGELYERALQSDLAEPTAAALATADQRARPSVRMVLLKGYSPEGFVFYTNLESRKARELAENPFGALCFHWQPLDAQVRIEGPVVAVADAEADQYFTTRPRPSQVAAWASLQSQPLRSPEELEGRLLEMEARFDGVAIPRPDYWSGYRIIPERIEFWSARPGRLHLRELYQRNPAEPAGWTLEALYP